MCNIRKILILNFFFLLLFACAPSDPASQNDVKNITPTPSEAISTVQIIKTAYEGNADFTIKSAYLRKSNLYITAASTVRKESAGTTIRLRVKDANGENLTKGPSGWVIINESANGQCVLITIGIPVPQTDTITIEGIEQITVGGIIKNSSLIENACVKKELQWGDVSLYVPVALLKNSKEVRLAAPVAELQPLPAFAESAGEPFELGPDGLRLAALPDIASTSVKHFKDYIDYIQQENEPTQVNISNIKISDETYCPGLLGYQPDMNGGGSWVTVPVQRRTYNAKTNTFSITANLLHFSVYAPVQYKPAHPEVLLARTLTFDTIKSELDFTESEIAYQKADELKQIYELLFASTDANFLSYLQNGLLDNSHSSTTAANTLINDITTAIAPTQWILDNVETSFCFNSTIYTGVGFFPVLHSAVKVSPADGKGPCYLIDRYVPGLNDLWMIGDERILSQPGAKEYDLRNIISVSDLFTDWRNAIAGYAATQSPSE